MKAGDLVQYYDAWYATINGEIEDVHDYNCGRILAIHGDRALVWWYNNDHLTHSESLEDVTIDWITISDYLTVLTDV